MNTVIYRRAAVILLLVCALAGFGVRRGEARTIVGAPLEGFVDVNGTRLQYLDWGGSGPALLLVHGLADNPYVFDDLAPAFVDRFHVIAYAQRGSGQSDEHGPYDEETQTSDLLGLMNALKITRANLAGYSAGGDVITRMAVEHADRVNRIIYLEGAYDWADPDFRNIIGVLPMDFFHAPSAATRSIGAYLEFEKNVVYPSVVDLNRIRQNIFQKIVVQQDGTIRNATSDQTVAALFDALLKNPPRDYMDMHEPVLAVFATHHYDPNVHSPDLKKRILKYEAAYWMPFQRKSMDRVRRELSNVRIVHTAGAHGSFLLTSRAQVVREMRAFLLANSQ